MNRMRFGRVAMTIAILAATGSSVDAAKKTRERATQLSHTFVNETGQVAYGLVIKLSERSIVLTDGDNKAGPFRNINDNDTTSIVLSNPDTPIGAGESADVTFRSYKGSARVKKYWWTDLAGKRIGDKKKV